MLKLAALLDKQMEASREKHNRSQAAAFGVAMQAFIQDYFFKTNIKKELTTDSTPRTYAVAAQAAIPLKLHPASKKPSPKHEPPLQLFLWLLEDHSACQASPMPSYGSYVPKLTLYIPNPSRRYNISPQG